MSNLYYHTSKSWQYNNREENIHFYRRYLIIKCSFSFYHIPLVRKTGYFSRNWKYFWQRECNFWLPKIISWRYILFFLFTDFTFPIESYTIKKGRNQSNIMVENPCFIWGICLYTYLFLFSFRKSCNAYFFYRKPTHRHNQYHYSIPKNEQIKLVNILS